MKEIFAKNKKSISLLVIFISTILIAFLVDRENIEPKTVNYDVLRFRMTKRYHRLVEKSKDPKHKDIFPVEIKCKEKSFVDADGINIFVKFILENNKFAVEIAKNNFDNEMGKILCELCCHFLLNKNVDVYLNVYYKEIERLEEVRNATRSISGKLERNLEIAKMVKKVIDDFKEFEEFEEFCREKLEIDEFKKIISDDAK